MLTSEQVGGGVGGGEHLCGRRRVGQAGARAGWSGDRRAGWGGGRRAGGSGGTMVEGFS